MFFVEQPSHVECVTLLFKLDVDKHIDVEIKLDELDLTSAETKATYAQIKTNSYSSFNTFLYSFIPIQSAISGVASPGKKN